MQYIFVNSKLISLNWIEENSKLIHILIGLYRWNVNKYIYIYISGEMSRETEMEETEMKLAIIPIRYTISVSSCINILKSFNVSVVQSS